MATLIKLSDMNKDVEMWALMHYEFWTLKEPILLADTEYRSEILPILLAGSEIRHRGCLFRP